MRGGRAGRWLRGIVAGAGALALVACQLNAGTKGEEEFTEHIRAAFGAHVSEIPVRSSNDMPGAGSLWGEVVLRPDTPADVFAEVLDAVETFEPKARVSYHPVGVRANGVSVCVDDPQRARAQALRDGLLARSASLQGGWVCGPRNAPSAAGYRGTFGAFVADTELVRSIGSDLELVGGLTRPEGHLSGRWVEVPTTVGPVVETVRSRHDLVALAIDGPSLRIAVDPTTDLSGTEAAVATVAGEGLRVELAQGALSPDTAQRYAAFGPIADLARAQPGVERAAVRSVHLELTVPAVADVVEVYRAVTEGVVDRPDGSSLVIIVPGADGRSGSESIYTRHASARGENVELFTELVPNREIARVRLTEDSDVQQWWLQLQVATSLEQTLPTLRGVIPEGRAVNLFGAGPDSSITLIARDRLTAEDITRSRLDVSARQRLAEAWNAGG